MERLEIIKCEKLVEEALRNVNKSKEAFDFYQTSRLTYV